MEKIDTKDIELSKIVQGVNSRQRDKQDVADLMADIKQNGLLQAIGVRREDNKIIYGNRRFLACKHLGLKTIRADIYEGVSDTDLMILNLAENIKRRDITFIEIGRIVTLLKEQGLKPSEIAVKLNMALSRVTRLLHSYNAILGTEFENYISYKENQAAHKGKVSETFAWAIQTNLSSRRQLSKKDWNDLIQGYLDGKINKDSLRILRGIFSADKKISVSKAIDWVQQARSINLGLVLNRKVLDEKRGKTPLSIWLIQLIDEACPGLIIK